MDMSESTTTTTTTKPKPKPKKATAKTPTVTKDKWFFAGYWNVLIGSFVLIVQGILQLVSLIGAGIGILGGSSLFLIGGATVWAIILSGILMIVLGLFFLILMWEPIQTAFNTGVILKDRMWLGIIFLVGGLLTLGVGGALVLVGGIFYLLSIPK